MTYTAPSNNFLKNKPGTDSSVIAGELALIDTELDAHAVLIAAAAGGAGSALASTKFIVGDGDGVAAPVNMSGDATLANTGAVTIAAAAVTPAKMSTLARGSILTGQTASNRPTALDAKTSGKILVGDGTDLASVAVSGDVTLAANGAVTAAARITTNYAHLTAGLGTRTAVATTGVDLASGSNAVYYGVFVAAQACTITGMVSFLNEAYIKDTTDAVIILKDRAGSPATKCTYTLPTGGSAAKTMVVTTPTSAALAEGDVLDLYVTASASSSGTGYADVFLKYIID